jgi:hypothetical protein
VDPARSGGVQQVEEVAGILSIALILMNHPMGSYELSKDTRRTSGLSDSQSTLAE